MMPADRLVNRKTFAAILGVDRSTVTRWVQAGRMDLAAGGLVDPVAAARMLDATASPEPHNQARKDQFDEARGKTYAQAVAAWISPEPAHPELEPEIPSEDAEGADQDSTDGMESLGVELKRATLELQRRKAELAALEVDKLSAALVPMADVIFAVKDFVAAMQAAGHNMPDRLAGEIAAHQGDTTAIHKSLSDWWHEFLLATGDRIDRRLNDLAP